MNTICTRMNKNNTSLKCWIQRAQMCDEMKLRFKFWPSNLAQSGHKSEGAHALSGLNTDQKPTKPNQTNIHMRKNNKKIIQTS
jgi:hypothetical protein